MKIEQKSPTSGEVVFEQVSKRYGDVTAVDAVSFRVAAGELVTLLGPSGCGKTTTLRMVAGLEPVTSGRVTIGGEDVTLRAANERNVSMVFQSYALFPHMTVLENVCYGPISMGTDKAKARELAHQKLTMLGLSGLEKRLPSELSGGQQQRVAVARSLVLEPAVLLFDEPLSNLDAKLRRHVREEIRELQQSLALTVLYVTHDQEEALAVSDRVIVMEDGRIAQEGTPEELYEAPKSRFLADFIGDANLVDGELRVDAGVATFEAGGVRLPVRADGVPAGPAVLAVRPHRLRVVPRGQGLIEGVCRRVAYLGSRAEYIVATPWGDLLVFDGNARTRVARETPVGIRFDPDAVIVLPDEFAEGEGNFHVMTIADRYHFLQSLSPRAGTYALDFWRRRAELVVELKGPQDFVSRADRAVEAMIRDEIARAFPGDAFLGEETANTIEGTPERVWIVDPIDGTHNFLRGIPYWNVSIAYVERGVRTLGAICDPVAGAVYHGRRGAGAWRTDAAGETRLAATGATALPGSLICIGHSDRFPDPRYLALRSAFMDHEVAFRNFGCAALQLAHVAEGRYDAYVELELSSWDAMAGLLLVEEAGGYVAPFPGAQGLAVRAPVIASAGGIGPTLHALVREQTGIA